MTDVTPAIEQRVWAKLLEGLALRDIGRTLALSDRNVRFVIDKLKRRYGVETVGQLLEKARQVE